MTTQPVVRLAGRSAQTTLLRSALIGLVVALAAAAPLTSAQPQTQLHCGPFTQDALPEPKPREYAHARERFERIKAAVKTQPYKVLFLGDSLTERFDQEVWQAHMAPRGVLNAGISGDRTEHLLWRLTHGNLDGPPPRAAVLLIGTNDLGHGRPPDLAAEGIRANLVKLRQRLPDAPILLLGLWPRADLPRIQERHEIAAVNRLIATCDGGAVTYAEIGGMLLEPDGRLLPQISPDRLHLSAQGYARVAPRLDALIDQLLAGH
ncbi:MAG TPA: GDSL-type esterase/lipase family protein [Stellaceae bacterium]|nr:GDSL-type esterase/lipase family protein [Stellaceae bacterium]